MVEWNTSVTVFFSFFMSDTAAFDYVCRSVSPKKQLPEIYGLSTCTLPVLMPEENSMGSTDVILSLFSRRAYCLIQSHSVWYEN